MIKVVTERRPLLSLAHHKLRNLAGAEIGVGPALTGHTQAR